MRKWLVRLVTFVVWVGAVAAVCVWLAPLWLTIVLPSMIAVGLAWQWIHEDLKASKEQVSDRT